MNEKIAIAGAGIAGLATALAFARQGLACTLYERRTPPSEVGAGIQMTPNAMRALAELGITAADLKGAVEPRYVRVRSGRSGATLARVPSQGQSASRYGQGWHVLLRGSLHDALLSAVEAQSNVDLVFGASVTRAEILEGTPTAPSQKVRITHQNAAGQAESATHSALVAADGVWSRLRDIIPGASRAAFTGKVAYRTLLPFDMVSESAVGAFAPTADDATGQDGEASLRHDVGLWLGPKAHLVHYPVAGGEALSIVAIVQEPWQEEQWSTKAVPSALDAPFASWCASAKARVAAQDNWLKWALCGVEPRARWSHGPVTLAGDAAHGMVPFLAQGAAMGLEDAVMLGRTMAAHGGAPTPAFATYERLRKPRVRRVWREAWANGTRYHLNGAAAIARDMALSALGGSRLLARYDWLYAWQPEAVGA